MNMEVFEIQDIQRIFDSNGNVKYSFQECLKMGDNIGEEIISRQERSGEIFITREKCEMIQIHANLFK